MQAANSERFRGLRLEDAFRPKSLTVPKSVFNNSNPRRLLKNPRMSRVSSLGWISVEGRSSIP